MFHENIFNINTTEKACFLGCGMILGYMIDRFYLRLDYLAKEKEERMNEEADFSDFGQGDLKLVLVVQNGLKMGKGKMAAQCAHASVMAYQHCALKRPKLLKEWLKSGQRKVVVKAESEEVLMEIAAKAKKAGLIINLVCDAGKTQIPSGSRTVLAVGPGLEQNIDKVTGDLKLL